MKNNDIVKTIDQYNYEMKQDKNHCFISWEHCYNYFGKDPAEIDIDTACLHLALFLASWGMYRQTGFLLGKDYRVHEETVRHILSEKRHLYNLDFADIHSENDERIIEIIQLACDITKKYNGNSVTDTLVSKILLATLACIPAHDRYFTKGLRLGGIKVGVVASKRFNTRFYGIIDFYNSHRDDFLKAQRATYEIRGVEYPPMKLVDMYFWQKGNDWEYHRT